MAIALKLSLKTRKQKKQLVKPLIKTRLLDITPIDFGLGSEKASSQVDEIVYGWKKLVV